MTARHGLWLFVAAAALVAALAYLRDPPWLITIESGFRAWETDSRGVRARWTGGHASFFVPSGAQFVTVPLRTTFARHDDGPVAVTVTIDDRPADRVTLADDGWRAILLRLPAADRRRVRRVDIRVDRVRSGNRGVQVGEVLIR
jgi:hypothetical protein